MVRALGVNEFLEQDLPIVDVRSPHEFVRGHIPEARSLPLFSDEERAIVGTLYKRSGRDAAVLEGLRIVGPRLAAIVEEARSIAPEGRIAVHCWRGGERSGSVAWLLDKAGFTAVHTLKGGYKAFRNHVSLSFGNERSLLVLGGYTGTGKTEALHHLSASGEQVIDLEALACHKGSSYGGLGQGPQPTTEHFENLLWSALRRTVPGRSVWIEDESAMIGRVKIPDVFFHRMRNALLFFANMPLEERAQRLVKDYGSASRKELAEATLRIERRMGPQHCKAALIALEAGDLRTVAIAALQYYDKAYARGLATRASTSVIELPAAADDLHDLAQRLIAHARSHQATGTPH